MENNIKKIKITTVITVIVAIIYGFILNSGFVPVSAETIVQNDFIGKQVLFTLNSPISFWWNLCLFPLAVISVLLMTDATLDASREEGKNIKTDTVFTIKFIKAISFIFGTFVLLMSLIIGVLASHYSRSEVSQGGPISAILYGLIVYMGLYIILAVWYGVIMTGFEDLPDDGGNRDLSLSVVLAERTRACIDSGMISTLPMMIGLVVGFIIRGTWMFFYTGISGAIKAYRKPKTA